jgi:alpha-D-xyloside xylohydrolase
MCALNHHLLISHFYADFFAWKFQGDWSFDPEFFPNPEEMAATVKNLTGAEMMVSLWPSVEDNSVNYLTLQENGWLETTRDGPGISDSFNGVYTRNVDSTNPGAREFLCIISSCRHLRKAENYYPQGRG